MSQIKPNIKIPKESFNELKENGMVVPRGNSELETIRLVNKLSLGKVYTIESPEGETVKAKCSQTEPHVLKLTN